MAGRAGGGPVLPRRGLGYDKTGAGGGGRDSAVRSSLLGTIRLGWSGQGPQSGVVGVPW